MKGNDRFFRPTDYGHLKDILCDGDLASVGDAYTNFVCSVALSQRVGKPVGMKVKGGVLAEALRRAGLRSSVPSGMSRHDLADAAEAFVVYGWLSGAVTLDESTKTIGDSTDLVNGLAELMKKIRSRAKLS